MELLYFIFGIVFIQLIIPILDGICNWLLSWIETKKAKHSEFISQINIKIRQATDEKPTSRAIGFQLPDPEEDEDDEI